MWVSVHYMMLLERYTYILSGKTTYVYTVYTGVPFLIDYVMSVVTQLKTIIDKVV